jgi:hypothetical protein
MSSDLRNLLHDAAIAPSAEADVAGAWRRGRRMRVRRLAAGGLVIVAVVALGSVGVASVLPNHHGSTPAASIATTPTTKRVRQPVRRVHLQCAALSTDPGDVPSWAASARPPGSMPHLLARDGNAIAFVFGYPLFSPESPSRSNKILWIVRQPRDGHPLAVTATLPGSNRGPVRMSFPANSSPGEIYPSDDNVPAPGCWHFALAWNGHRSSINLAYVPLIPATATTTTTIPTTPTTAVPAGGPSCSTVSLTISLGAPNGSAGHMNYEIAFRNHSGASCVLSGYPGVSFLDSSGRQVGVPAQRNPIPHSPVTLAPGATAYAHLATTDPSVLSGCPATAVHQIRVYPPNETSSALVAADGVSVCSSPTTPGSSIDPVVARPN